MVEQDLSVSELEIAVNEHRVLVFIETAPQSNRYRQVIFDRPTFRKMTSTLGTVVDRIDGIEIFKTLESIEEYTLPDLHSINK